MNNTQLGGVAFLRHRLQGGTAIMGEGRSSEGTCDVTERGLIGEVSGDGRLLGRGDHKVGATTRLQSCAPISDVHAVDEIVHQPVSPLRLWVTGQQPLPCGWMEGGDDGERGVAASHHSVKE
jgi:hypothetical protein